MAKTKGKVGKRTKAPREGELYRGDKYIITNKMSDEATELARGGATINQIAVHFGMSKQAFNFIADKDPAVNEMRVLWQSLAQCWWERLGQSGAIGGQEVQATLYSFIVKNRFREDYGDTLKTENKTELDASVSIHFEEV